MDVYTRYFRVTTGPLIESVRECRAVNRTAKTEYAAILRRIGADERYYACEHRLVAITFPEPPDTKLFKRNKYTRDGWYPKKNCKRGKEIATALEAVKTKDIGDCLAAVGLYSGPSLIIDGCAYSATLLVIPSDPLVTFVSVPWYDENPEALEQYMKGRKAGTHRCMSLDALLWEPTAEMTEVKEWEYMKAIQEWNDSLGMEEKYA